MARILLIDDDVDLVEINRVVLASRGHEVIVAYSAAEAKRMLQSVVPDAAVIDVMMETDSAGFDLAREIHEKHPQVASVILSALHDAKELPFRFEPDETWLPVALFLDKPVDPARLADTIEALIAKH